MLGRIVCSKPKKQLLTNVIGLRNLNQKHSRGPCDCGAGGGSAGRRIVPPPKCSPGPIPPNPCVPRFHHGKDTWKKYRLLSLLMFPIIIFQSFRALSHEPPHKTTCRDFEYMRIRSKRFPWGDGTRSFFHSDHYNHLPGECEVPELDCD